jgi:CRP/FNR family transcriptional regulator
MNGKQPWPDSEVFRKGIFTALPEQQWKTSKSFTAPTVVDKKSILFNEGEDASDMFLIGGGLVKTFKNPTNDRVQIVNIFGPGDVLGAEALTRETYESSATSLARSLIFKCKKDEFLECMSEHPTLSVTLIKLLNHENAALQTLLYDVGTKKALPRVASCLLLFMEKQVKPGESRPFNLPISRQEMGAFLGLSPETVSRQLKDLTTSRVIRLEHRRLTVLDLKHLKSIAQA